MKEKELTVEEKIDQNLLRTAENTIRISSLEKILIEKGFFSEQELSKVNTDLVQKFLELMGQAKEAQVKSE